MKLDNNVPVLTFREQTEAEYIQQMLVPESTMSIVQCNRFKEQLDLPVSCELYELRVHTIEPHPLAKDPIWEYFNLLLTFNAKNGIITMTAVGVKHETQINLIPLLKTKNTHEIKWYKY